MSKRFPLNILESYAMSLTPKQVKMLYESKTKKKMSNALFEAAVPDANVIQYEFWIDSYIVAEFLDCSLEEAGTILRSFTDSLQAGQYSFSVNEEGIGFKTSDADIYDEYIAFVEDSFEDLPAETLNLLIDPRYLAEN